VAARLLAIFRSTQLVEVGEGAGAAWRWAPNPLPRALTPLAGVRTLSLLLLGALWRAEVREVAPGGGEGAVVVSMALGGGEGEGGAGGGEGETPLAVVFHDARPPTRDDGAGAPQPTPLALTMPLTFRPGRPWAPLTLPLAAWQQHVKLFYSSLWFEGGGGGVLARAVSEELTSSFSLTADDVKAFSEATGLPCDVGGAPGGGVAAATPFAIVAGWRAVVQSLFPSAIAANILDLVHLSNEFRLAEVPPSGAPWLEAPLSPGETVRARLRVTSVVNGTRGKTVTVSGRLCRDGAPFRGSAAVSGDGVPWVWVVSKFFFRGVFSDHGACFQTSAPDDGVAAPLTPLYLPTPAAVAVLLGKAWFSLAPGAPPPAPGSTLFFELVTAERFAPGAPGRFASITVRGRALASREPNAALVGTVSYRFEGGAGGAPATAGGNVVTAYLASSAGGGDAPARGVIPLPEGAAYTLLPSPLVVTAPPSNTPYAAASLDLNPIHRNATLAALAGLPGTITHGMWTSAQGFLAVWAALDVELGNVAPGGPAGAALSWVAQRMIRSYSATFTGMVLPGDTLVAQVSHVGHHGDTGLRALRVAVAAVREGAPAPTPVLDATAAVEALPTAFVFTGQGSADKGMGMALYGASPVARAVWDAAEAHLLKTYGFSILDIVKRNPTELTVHFGGRAGARVRENYAALTRARQSAP